MVDTMLRLPMHLMVTLRTKVAYVVETDARGKHVPCQVGMAPIQREGCEYEFDVMGELHSDGLTITKTRLRSLQGLTLAFDPQAPIAPGRELGRRIAADLQGEPPAWATTPDVSEPMQQVEPHELKQLWRRIKEYHVDHEAFRACLKQMHLQSTKELSHAQLEQCLSEIHTRQRQAFKPYDAPDTQSDAPTQGTRAQLCEALTRLQAEITQAQQTPPPGEASAQTLIDLAQWIPRVARACEYPDTPEDQLRHYLAEVHQSLDDLQQMTLAEASA
jgi:hypothetical protein